MQTNAKRKRRILHLGVGFSTIVVCSSKKRDFDMFLILNGQHRLPFGPYLANRSGCPSQSQCHYALQILVHGLHPQPLTRPHLYKREKKPTNLQMFPVQKLLVTWRWNKQSDPLNKLWWNAQNYLFKVLKPHNKLISVSSKVVVAGEVLHTCEQIS